VQRALYYVKLRLLRELPHGIARWQIFFFVGLPSPTKNKFLWDLPHGICASNLQYHPRYALDMFACGDTESHKKKNLPARDALDPQIFSLSLPLPPSLPSVVCAPLTICLEGY